MKRAAYPIDSPSPSKKTHTQNTTPRVLVSDPIEKDCLDILKQADIHVDCVAKKTEDELVQLIKDYDGLIVRSGTTVTAKIIDAATKLRCIGRAGTGTDNIDCVAATRKGIVVCNTPGGNTVPPITQHLPSPTITYHHLPSPSSTSVHHPSPSPLKGDKGDHPAPPPHPT